MCAFFLFKLSQQKNALNGNRIMIQTEPESVLFRKNIFAETRAHVFRQYSFAQCAHLDDASNVSLLHKGVEFHKGIEAIKI
jgi:hypothetical protein